MDINTFTNKSGEFEYTFLQGKECYAFKPNPLPVEGFDIDIEFAGLLSEARAKLEALKMIDIPTTKLPDLSRVLFSKTILKNEVASTQRIENNNVTLRDIFIGTILEREDKLLPITSQTSGASINEAIDNLKALTFLIDKEISIRNIKSAHQLLMSNAIRKIDSTPGEFRDKDCWIGSSSKNDVTKARFIPVKHIHIEELMNNLVEYVNNFTTQQALIRMAIAHYQFEAIHPFNDGNGRMGRILIQNQINKYYLNSRYSINIASYFEKNKNQYYDMLLDVSKKSAFKEWVAFFLEGIIEQSEESIALLGKIRDIREKWLFRIDKNPEYRKSKYDDKVVEIILGSPFFSYKTLASEVDIPKRTIVNIINKFEELGILTSFEQKSRPKMFIALDVIKLLEESE
jgi:Fic family protein